MSKSRQDYSSIKNRKELQNAINEINYLISEDLEKIDIRIDSIKQKFSFVHIAEKLVSRYQVYYNTVMGVYNTFRNAYNMYQNSNSGSSKDSRQKVHNCEQTETEIQN